MIIIIVIVLLIIVVFSARWNWWRLPEPGIPILMYHKIGEPPRDSKIKKLWVTEKQFEKHCAYLEKHGYESITFEDIAQNHALPSKAVIITFDDGYENNFTSALPLLKRYGFRAVFFIVAEAIGRDNFWHNPETEKRISMMKPAQLQQLVSEGHEIASHTCSHPNIESADSVRIKQELTESKQILEKIIGKKVVSCAYPYGGGAFDPSIQEIVKKIPYQYACAIRQGKADLKKSALCLKRLLIRGDDTMFDFYLNLTRGKSRF